MRFKTLSLCIMNCTCFPWHIYTGIDFEVKGQGSNYSGHQMSESKSVIDLTERMDIKNMIIQDLVILSVFC